MARWDHIRPLSGVRVNNIVKPRCIIPICPGTHSMFLRLVRQITLPLSRGPKNRFRSVDVTRTLPTSTRRHRVRRVQRSSTTPSTEPPTLPRDAQQGHQTLGGLATSTPSEESVCWGICARRGFAGLLLLFLAFPSQPSFSCFSRFLAIAASLFDILLSEEVFSSFPSFLSSFLRFSSHFDSRSFRDCRPA